jgi:hypothetical protein
MTDFSGDFSHSVNQSMSELRMVTRRLRLLGLVIVLFTVGSVLEALILPLFPGYDLTNRSLALMAASLAVAALALIILYDRTRRRGEALFEEISDEFQWYIARPTTKGGVTPPLDVRVVLRTFAKTSDLPIVPGRFGPAIYATVNIVAALITVFLLSGRMRL